jgi:glutaredoxin
MRNVSIIVYGFEQCPVCQQAKAWLKEKQISFEFIDVPERSQREVLYAEWTRESHNSGMLETVNSMPQIFIDGDRLGGYDKLISTGLHESIAMDFKALDAAGLLGVAATPPAPVAVPRRVENPVFTPSYPVDPNTAGWHLWEYEMSMGIDQTRRWQMPLYWQPGRPDGVWLRFHDDNGYPIVERVEGAKYVGVLQVYTPRQVSSDPYPR